MESLMGAEGRASRRVAASRPPKFPTRGNSPTAGNFFVRPGRLRWAHRNTEARGLTNVSRIVPAHFIWEILEIYKPIGWAQASRPLAVYFLTTLTKERICILRWALLWILIHALRRLCEILLDSFCRRWDDSERSWGRSHFIELPSTQAWFWNFGSPTPSDEKSIFVLAGGIVRRLKYGRIAGRKSNGLWGFKEPRSLLFLIRKSPWCDEMQPRECWWMTFLISSCSKQPLKQIQRRPGKIKIETK